MVAKQQVEQVPSLAYYIRSVQTTLSKKNRTCKIKQVLRKRSIESVSRFGIKMMYIPLLLMTTSKDYLSYRINLRDSPNASRRLEMVDSKGIIGTLALTGRAMLSGYIKEFPQTQNARLPDDVSSLCNVI